MSIRRCTQIDGSYSSEWWSIRLPSGWSISEESDCVLFHRGPQAGVLRVSAARKPDGCVVEADFSDLIGEMSQGCSAAQPIQAGQYFGFSRECERGTALAEWWLAHDSVLVYFSFTRRADTGTNELRDVRRVVESVQIKDPSPAS